MPATAVTGHFSERRSSIRTEAAWLICVLAATVLEKKLRPLPDHECFAEGFRAHSITLGVLWCPITIFFGFGPGCLQPTKVPLGPGSTYHPLSLSHPSQFSPSPSPHIRIIDSVPSLTPASQVCLLSPAFPPLLSHLHEIRLYMSLKSIYNTANMSPQTPGTPSPDTVTSTHIETASPLYFKPYGTSEGHTTFLNYRNPDNSTAGGSGVSHRVSIGHSDDVDSMTYDPNSAEFKHRSVHKSPEGEFKPKTTGADLSRHRSSPLGNVGLASNAMLGNKKTGHDAIDDMSNQVQMRPRAWSEQPLVLAGIWLGIVGLVYVGWVYLGRFNRDGKRSLIEIL